MAVAGETSQALDRHRHALDQFGYTVLPSFLPQERVQSLAARLEQLWEKEGDQAGSEFRQEPHTRRLANLVDKDPLFWDLIVEPTILELVRHVLGSRYKLSSLNARSANPRSPSAQPLHVDMGALPDEQGYSVCNVVWMIDAFTADNGALRVVPGTHRSRRLPQQVLADPRAPHPEEKLVTAPAGSVVVLNAHTWHGGTENRTNQPRRAIHSFYCRWDLPQQQYQKALLSRQTQAALSPLLRQLLALDDPLNDQLSSLVEKPSGFLK